MNEEMRYGGWMLGRNDLFGKYGSVLSWKTLYLLISTLILMVMYIFVVERLSHMLVLSCITVAVKMQPCIRPWLF